MVSSGRKPVTLRSPVRRLADYATQVLEKIVELKVITDNKYYV